MLFEIAIYILIILNNLVTADHGSLKSCYDCAHTNNGLNYMCNFNNRLPDPWRSICCSPNNPSSFCKPNSKNKCSNTFK